MNPGLDAIVFSYSPDSIYLNSEPSLCWKCASAYIFVTDYKPNRLSFFLADPPAAKHPGKKIKKRLALLNYKVPSGPSMKTGAAADGVFHADHAEPQRLHMHIHNDG